MKKGSSKHIKKGQPKQQPTQEGRRYPTKDNVYELQKARQTRQYTEQSANRQEARGPRRAPKQAPYARTREKRKPMRKASRVLPMFVFAIVALYLCGQMVNMAVKKPDVNVETVTMGTIDTPQRYEGLIVRDEYVVKSTRGGQPFYQYSPGDYVPKNAVVCTVKDTESTDVIEGKLDKIDKDILKNQKNRTDLSAFSEDIARIEDTIQRTVDGYAGRFMKSDMSYLYNMKGQVTTSMMQRNEIWLTENVESLSQLTDEKNVYEQQLAQNMSAIRNSESGVLALSYDGLEETLTPETLEGITKAQIGESKIQYISKTKAAAESDSLFKIVCSNQWYITAYLPNASAVDWKKGDEQILNIVTEEESVQLAARVEAIETGEKETKVTFSTYEQMQKFIDQRMVTFHLDSEMVEGLKIPNDAIVEKSLIAIPVDCVTESTGNRGVLLVNGDKTKFIAMSTVSSDEEMIYIEQGGEVKLGDIILKGTGETATQYSVSALKPITGVYIANSSMAKFVTIDILDQNQEYAIIRSGTTYGLQAYDTIISDAKNISEGQSVY